MKVNLRRLWVLILALLALCCFTALAAADDIIAEGDLNNGTIHWCLDTNQVLTISGEGEMPDYSMYAVPWYNYRGRITSVVVENGITSIGEYAFLNCTVVTNISIPESVTFIGRYAFSNCTALTNISLSKKITSIEERAFNGCTSLANITIPEGVISIGVCAFSACTSLTSISLPTTLQEVAYLAFYDCECLATIYFSGSLEDWSNISFDKSYLLDCAKVLYIDNTFVQNLIIPEGVTEIGDYAFYGYDGLNSVTFPAGLQSIGEHAFYECDNLIYAEFAGATPAVNESAFDNNTVLFYHKDAAGWTSPTWSGYTTAQIEPFDDYSALDEENRNAQGILFTLNATAKTAIVGNGSDNAGYYGAQRGAVIIPDTVTKNGVTYTVIGIGQSAFSENKLVTSVSIGSGVSSVIPTAFRNCPNLESFTVSDKNTYYKAQDGVLYDAEGLYLYVYPGGKQDTEFTVPNTVKTIGGKAFTNNAHLSSLVVGRSVTAIYSSAFLSLNSLTELTLPFIGKEENDTRHYMNGAFRSVFGSYAPESLQTVTILGGNLSEDAFYNCEYLKEITLANTPETIPEQCFYGCTDLQKLTFADSGRTCETGQLILPEGVITVEMDAFYSCSGITSVELPASLTDLHSTAFSGSGLEAFSVAAGNKHYNTDNWGVLYNKDKTTLVQYPPCRPWPYYNVADTATKISSEAFYGCSQLVNLYIPKTVTSIGSAIKNCPNLTLCCFMGSEAYGYARNNSLTAWYMDNKTLQGIRVYSLPEQTVQQEGAVNLQGLYIVGDYQGKELQIDDYTLSYDQTTSGVKTVTVEYQGKTVTFEMIFYTTENGNVIGFCCEEDLDGKTVMIAVYSTGGEMLCTDTATIIDSEARISVSDRVYQNADYAKLFILDEDYAPSAEAQTQPLE